MKTLNIKPINASDSDFLENIIIVNYVILKFSIKIFRVSLHHYYMDQGLLGVSDKVRLKQVFATTETIQQIESSPVASLDMKLSKNE